MKRSPQNLRRCHARRPAKIAGTASALLLSIVGLLRAVDVPNAVTMDLPLPADAIMPAWLGHPETPATSFATLDLPILTTPANASLLVTVFFTEKQGGFLRILWKGTQGSQVLSENFYEDIGMSNQRTLLIAGSTMLGDGTLSFQGDNATLGVSRIRLEWLQPKVALVSPDLIGQIVAPSIGAAQTAAAFNGAKSSGSPAAWQDEIVSVPLSDSPVRIEDGVEFSVDLDKVPGLARLALKEAGLPLGQHLVVWVNQRRAGTITPSVPDLLDDGFTTADASSADYVGWRDGSFYVPVKLLKEGVNSVVFSQEDDGAGSLLKPVTGSEALALKSIVVQLDYESVPLTSAIPAPQLAMPSGPIAPSLASAFPTSPTP